MSQTADPEIAPATLNTEAPRRRRRLSKSDLRWVALAIGVALLLRVLLTRDMRLQFITGASLTQGALIAAIALGVVLTYAVLASSTSPPARRRCTRRTSTPTSRVNGRLFIPPLPNPLVLIEAVAHHLDKKSTLTVPHWPTYIDFGGRLTLVSALLVSLVFGVVFGLALHFLVFRPLRKAPPLAKVVASVGVLLLLQAIVVRRFGTSAQATQLGNGVAKQVKFPFGITMNTEALTVIIIVIVFTVLLWALFRYARFGLRHRAAGREREGRNAPGVLARLPRRFELGAVDGDLRAAGNPRRGQPALGRSARRSRSSSSRRSAWRSSAISHRSASPPLPRFALAMTGADRLLRSNPQLVSAGRAPDPAGRRRPVAVPRDRRGAVLQGRRTADTGRGHRRPVAVRAEPDRVRHADRRPDRGRRHCVSR